ncbi:hypothetical protein A606_05305 [Corynebacterium terpenotabidum Y-11]|uniref:Uncharacterized protein n=1 Tax=Corynebacterium terpenotabidum Y-11 TaxID=1200352 RepID=S4XJF2_9CORY|nr:hypothetical protein A606_05305 [Corynebacterium terpenotabidum Y-11]
MRGGRHLRIVLLCAARSVRVLPSLRTLPLRPVVTLTTLLLAILLALLLPLLLTLPTTALSVALAFADRTTLQIDLVGSPVAGGAVAGAAGVLRPGGM